MSKSVKFKFYKKTSVPRFAAVATSSNKNRLEYVHRDSFVVIIPEYEAAKEWLKGEKTFESITPNTTIHFFNSLEHEWFFYEEKRNIRPMSQKEWDNLYDDCKLKMIMDFITWHTHSHLEYNGLCPEKLDDYKLDI